MRSPAHSFAKHTLNALTATLASAFRGTGVLVKAIDPGRVATHPEFRLALMAVIASVSGLKVVHVMTVVLVYVLVRGPERPAGAPGTVENHPGNDLKVPNPLA